MRRVLQKALKGLEQLTVDELKQLSVAAARAVAARERRSKAETVAEETHGAVTYRQQLVRCGKPCHCQEGKLHGPYWYAFWWDEGRTRSRYVGKTLKRLGRLEAGSKE